MKKATISGYNFKTEIVFFQYIYQFLMYDFKTTTRFLKVLQYYEKSKMADAGVQVKSAYTSIFKF